MMAKNQERIGNALTDGLAKAGIGPDDCVLVACSGGPDSMALLSAAGELGRREQLDVRACHLDHGVRGLEGKRDAALVARFCRDKGIPLHRGRLDGDRVRRAVRRHGSLESALREARYAFLKDVAGHTGARVVLTGHHRQDQRETILFRAARGMNWRSLTGIPRSRGLYLRPLLDIDRAQIEEYCRQQGVPWTSDSSNRDLGIARNRIRHVSLPALKRDFHVRLPHLLDRLNRATGRLLVIEEALLRRVDAAPIAPAETPTLALAPLADLNDALLEGALLRFFRSATGRYPAGRACDHLGSMVRAGRTGDVSMGGGITARVGGGHVILLGPEDPSRRWRGTYLLTGAPGRVDIGGTGMALMAEESEGPAPAPPAGGTDVWSPAHRVVWPLMVRTRTAGDRFQPAGMSGRMKLKKYLIGRKVPRHLRDSLPVVVDGRGDIIWIPGVGHSQKIRTEPADAGGRRWVHLRLEGSGFLRDKMPRTLQGTGTGPERSEPGRPARRVRKN